MILGERDSHAPRHPLKYSDQEVDPASPQNNYTMVYSSNFCTDFRGNLSWLMMDYCEVVRLTQGQLDLIAWGLIRHRFLYRNDCQGFSAQPLSRESHRFTLVRCMGRGKPTPVSLPTHLVPPLGRDYFLFLLHSGTASLPTDWAPACSRS